MTYKIQLVDEIISEETREALARWLLGNPRLTMGEQVARFEREFARLVGRRHAVMTNSGSSANLLVAQLMADRGVKRVAVSALTWATNVMPLMQLGMEPVPVDVDPATLNIGSRIPDDVDAVFATCALGWSPPMEQLAEQCEDIEAVLALDCCEALGSKIDGVHLGALGDAATYSFYAGHHISTIEGGMVVCDSDKTHDMLLMYRSHGWARDLSQESRDRLGFDGRFVFHRCGYNVRPTEIQGLLGLMALESYDDMVYERSHIYHRLYRAQRFGIKIRDCLSQIVPMAYPVICESRKECEERIARLGRLGIETRPMIAGNITRQPFWRYPRPPLPGADHLHDCSFYAPLRPGLTEEQLQIYEEALS